MGIFIIKIFLIILGRPKAGRDLKIPIMGGSVYVAYNFAGVARNFTESWDLLSAERG